MNTKNPNLYNQLRKPGLTKDAFNKIIAKLFSKKYVMELSPQMCARIEGMLSAKNRGVETALAKLNENPPDLDAAKAILQNQIKLYHKIDVSPFGIAFNNKDKIPASLTYTSAELRGKDILQNIKQTLSVLDQTKNVFKNLLDTVTKQNTKGGK